MVNSITSSLSIVKILTKRRSKNKFLSKKNYISGLHMQEAIFKVNTVKDVAKTYIKIMFTIW